MRKFLKALIISHQQKLEAAAVGTALVQVISEHSDDFFFLQRFDQCIWKEGEAKLNNIPDIFLKIEIAKIEPKCS